MCIALVSSSTVAVSDDASCMMAAASSSRLGLVLALLNRHHQPRLSMSLVGLMYLKSRHGPASEARLTVTACASICCVCRVNVETLTWTSGSGWREANPLRSRAAAVLCVSRPMPSCLCQSLGVGRVTGLGDDTK